MPKRDERLSRPRRYVDAPDPCPLEHLHTKGPATAGSFMLWMVKMRRTHKQVMCEGCKQYKIWEPKEKKNAPSSE